MSGSEIAQIITAIGLLITSGTGLWALIESKRNGLRIADVATNVGTLEKNTNSKMDALLAVTAKAATAEGAAAGIVEGHAAGLEQGRKEERK